MRIHYIQHVPFEDLANIWMWANEKGHSVTSTKLYLEGRFPSINSFDWLIVMGGPMNIYEEEKYPWLAKEKKFIEETIKSGKFVLGICLGGQLVADVLGGKVRRNNHKEIGWLRVKKIDEGSGYFRSLPKEFIAFHWHGDTFDIPPGATRLVESEGCLNQAFEYSPNGSTSNKNVLCLQFHLESSEASIRQLIENCKDDMTASTYVQTQDEILSGNSYFAQSKIYMKSLLDEVESRIVATK